MNFKHYASLHIFFRFHKSRHMTRNIRTGSGLERYNEPCARLDAEFNLVRKMSENRDESTQKSARENKRARSFPLAKLFYRAHGYIHLESRVIFPEANRNLHELCRVVFFFLSMIKNAHLRPIFILHSAK